MVNEIKKIMSEDDIRKTLSRLAHEVLEKNTSPGEIAVIGIRRRGAFLAERMTEKLMQLSEKKVFTGAIDITMYRDDLTEIAEQPVIHETEIPFDITGKNIVLMDDVLFTGRTVRCALDEIIDYGRPARIQLAVLIDRGHRELPIRPDFTGKNLPTALGDNVEVRLREVDEEEEVLIQRGGKDA